MKFASAALCSLAILAFAGPVWAQDEQSRRADFAPAQQELVAPAPGSTGLLLPAVQRARGASHRNGDAPVNVAAGDVTGDGRADNAAPITGTNLTPVKSACPTCTVTGVDD